MKRIRKMSHSARSLSAMMMLGIAACSLSGCVRSMLQSRLPESADAQQPVAEVQSTPQLRNPADLKPGEGAQACVATADSLAAKGHAAEAVKLLLKARQLDPKQQVAHRLAVLYDRHGNWAEAEQYLQEALHQSPENQRIQTNLALAYAKQGKYEESLTLFTSAVGPAAAHSNLGVLYAQAGRIDDAQRELQRALTIDPSLSQAEAILARLSPSETARVRP